LFVFIFIELQNFKLQLSFGYPKYLVKETPAPPPPRAQCIIRGDKGNINKGVERKGEGGGGGKYRNPENNAFTLFTCLVNILNFTSVYSRLLY